MPHFRRGTALSLGEPEHAELPRSPTQLLSCDIVIHSHDVG